MIQVVGLLGQKYWKECNNTIPGWYTSLIDAEFIWDINLSTIAGYGVVTKYFYIGRVVSSGT